MADNAGNFRDAPHFMLKKRFNARLTIVCLAAASVGLSMVIISIAKLLLVICGLATLLLTRRTSAHPHPLLATTYTPIALLLTLLMFTLSLLWSVAPPAEALGSLAKYGKLLVIPLMMLLIQNRREALYALGAFVLAQLFLQISSWMLVAHLPIPWATSHMALTNYAVFSTYLDQSIISAVFAALCWHLRFLAPGRFGRQLGVLAAFLALVMVFFVFQGRSGHAVAIALLSVSIMWELPKRYRAAVLLLPFMLALGLYAGSGKVRERLSLVATEVQAYSSHEEQTSSSGIRLHFWQRAVQLIGQHPLLGSGVGSWSTEYDRLQHEENLAPQFITSSGNPHQEYLLWGVQLGILGILMFLGLLLCMLRDTLKMETPYARTAQLTLLALAVASLFNASLYDAQIGDFFCVLIGLLLALGLTPNTANAPNHPQHEPSA